MTGDAEQSSFCYMLRVLGRAWHDDDTIPSRPILILILMLIKVGAELGRAINGQRWHMVLARYGVT